MLFFIMFFMIKMYIIACGEEPHPTGIHKMSGKKIKYRIKNEYISDNLRVTSMKD